MLYFDCYRSANDKMNYSSRFIQHASEHGVTTLCGLTIKLTGNWTRGSGFSGELCSRCCKKLEAARKPKFLKESI
jgi:hypothetical protein